MFEMADRHMDSQTERICSRVISLSKAEVPVEQRRIIRAEVRQELETLAWSFFGTFDNVGCGLPDEVLGYSIKVQPSDDSLKDVDVRDSEHLDFLIAQIDEIDMRDDETDYADMWLEFLLTKKAK